MKPRPFTLAAALFAALSSAVVADTWTNVDGQSMEAELFAADARFASFRKADGGTYNYPVAKLSEADRARVAEFAAKNPEAAPPAPTPASAPPPVAGALTSELAGKLVSLKGGRLTPVAREQILPAKFYALYFSAHWCPPCRGFTPDLVAAYEELKAEHPEFEIVFVSSDRDAKAMAGYMAEYKMGFPAVRFDAKKTLRAVQRHAAPGIPNLVFLNSDGEVISSSYVGDRYVGPRKVLKDIRATLAKKS